MVTGMMIVIPEVLSAAVASKPHRPSGTRVKISSLWRVHCGRPLIMKRRLPLSTCISPSLRILVTTTAARSLASLK